MPWFEQALELHAQGKNYSEIGRELKLSRQAVSKRFKSFRENGGEQTSLNLNETEEVVVSEKDTLLAVREVLLKELKRSRTMPELLRKVPKEATEQHIEQVISELIVEDYVIDHIDGRYFFRKNLDNADVRNVLRDWSGDRVIKFGICSDTHMNSKYQQLTHLNSFYDLCVAEGITEVYHVGDVVEGTYLRRDGHIYEIFNHSADDQVDYVIENYPHRKGVTTYFITGNHDHTHLKQGGYDIGRPIARERDDMKYLGINYAKIQLTPNCRMDLSHPLDGSSYALSYSLQKSIEAMPINDLPDIYVVGHHHKSIYLHTRGIHALEAGTFQAQTGWMRGKRLAAHVGGWICTVHVDKEGFITRFQPEWVPFNDRIEKDY